MYFLLGVIHMKNIAIVIPVYNNYDGLIVALESLQNQTCKDFTVLIIDDGSDNKILYETLPTDLDIILLTNDTNIGIGLTRNKALRYLYESIYKYVMFLDSDDTLKNNAIEVINDAIKSNKHMDWIQFYAEMPPNEYIQLPSESVWTGVYKIQSLISHNIIFPDIRLCEDLFFITLLYLCNFKKILIEDILYTHKYRENSLVHSKSSNTEKCFIESVYYLCEFIENYPGYFSLHNANKLSNLISYCYVCHQICKFQKSSNKDLEDKIKFIIKFCNNYGIMQYNAFDVPSQILLSDYDSVIGNKTKLLVFNQSFNKWLNKYGFVFDIKVEFI